MKIDKIQNLLNAMEFSDTPFSSQQCADLLGLSAENFRKSLQEINDILSPSGARIEGKRGRGNGYRLVIDDMDTYHHFLESDLQTRIYFENSFNFSQEQRVSEIALLLLSENAWQKSEEFAEKLGLSASQFSKDLQQCRKLMKDFNLTIENKPYYGIRVEGKEIDRRKCLKYIYKQHRNEKAISISYDSMIREIESIVLSECDKFGYTLHGVTLDNLVMHLFITLRRVERDQEISIPEEEKEMLANEEEFALATAIATAMQKCYQVEFHDDEVYYVVMHLSSKKILQSVDSITDSYVFSLVDRMLSRIWEEQGIDLSGDLNLRIMMALHLSPLIRRIRYNMKLENPLLEEIRKKLITSYELAQVCATVLNEEFHTHLSDDEIAYFALHIEIPLSERKTSKQRILLVCSTGRGSAQLMKYNFERRYKDSIDNVDTCDVIDLKNIDMKNYDSVFTTIPLKPEDRQHILIPVFLIDALTNDIIGVKPEEVFRTRKDISQLQKVFRKDMFFGQICVSDKEEAIEEICRRISVVYPLPEGFKNAVYEREQLAQTNFGGRTAFPHPDKVMTEDTFVSVTVLKKPIDWGSGYVQIILLSSFSKGFIVKNQDVMEVISELIQNERVIDTLIKRPEYSTLMELMASFEKRD